VLKFFYKVKRKTSLSRWRCLSPCTDNSNWLNIFLLISRLQQNL